jgi:hypothetical protein
MGFLSPKPPPLPPVQAPIEAPSSELSDEEKAQIKKDKDAIARRKKRQKLNNINWSTWNTRR